jgi:hypothetical protein
MSVTESSTYTQSYLKASLEFESTFYGWSPEGTEAMPSPASPTFPLENSYRLPQANDWPAWSAKDLGAPSLPQANGRAAFTMAGVSASPVVNPLHLAMGTSDTPFGIGSFEDPLIDDLLNAKQPAQTVAKSRKLSSSAATPAKRESIDSQAPSRSGSDMDFYPSRKRRSNGSAVSSPALSPSSPPGTPNTAGRRSPTAQPAGPKKTAHNMIEKRYRNNLNDKIAALRDAVPCLRAAQRRLEQGLSADEPSAELDDDLEDTAKLGPVQKLNKATILGKAAEYIALLEKQNRKLIEENEQLRRASGK